MPVVGLDHAAIPTDRPEEMMAFYRKLGFVILREDEWRSGTSPIIIIQFGNNRINVHPPALWRSPGFTLRGADARPGCGDFCFVWEGGNDLLMQSLASAQASIEIGPVDREGGRCFHGMSIYTRDPDSNLLEFIIYGNQSSSPLTEPDSSSPPRNTAPEGHTAT
ncbi:VOC family protein [Pseudarthrobacter siccitolerans]